MICAACTESIDGADTCPACGEAPLLEGRYRLEEVVGEGGMGRTYRAMRVADGSVVAVKELPIRQVEDVKAMELFEREASVLEQLDHPGIPDFYGHFSAGQGRNLAVYLVQEFIDGPTLAEVADRAALDEDDVLAMMAEVVEILEYLHGLAPPVIHRDVKPTNIMGRGEPGELVLIDFGSVRTVLDDQKEGGSTVAGTFGFMAPEQFMGRAQPSTDIYGLGATAVALLSDTHPRELLDHDRKLHWQSAVDIDPAFTALLDEMLRPEADERPADPSALVDRIDRIRRGEATAATPATTASGPLGPPPRELPENFWDRFGDEHRFHMQFGGIFGGLGLIVIVASIAGVAVGEVENIGQTVCGLSLPVLFTVIGGWIVGKGWRRRRAMERAYRHGSIAAGTITRTTEADYSQNDDHPVRIFYQFEVEDGVETGYVDSFEKTRDDVEVDAPVRVLYDPDEPSRNLGLVHDQ